MGPYAFAEDTVQTNAGPLRPFTDRSRCCGRIPLSGHLLHVQNSAEVEFTEGGTMPYFVFCFASAAFIRSRGMQVSTPGHKSPNRSFASAFLTVIGTALSLRPSRATEPRRVCRRLRPMSRMEHHDKDNEQVFTGSARTCCVDFIGWRGAASKPLGGDCVDFIGDQLRAQTLDEWVKKVEVDTRQRRGVTTEQAEKMKALERDCAN